MQEQQLRARRAILAQQAAGAAAAAAKSSREVYVGNLVAGAVTEEVLRTLFNSSMRMAFPEAGAADPVVSASVHPDGRYAFVELRTPDMAQAALALNGSVALAGQALSLGRPTGYVDPERALEAARAASAALGRFQARGQAQEEEERAGGDAARPSSGESAFVRLAQSPASVSLDSAQQARWLRDFVSKELEGFGGVLDCMLVSEKEATNPEIGGDDVVAPAEARDTQEEQAALDSGPGAPAAPPADLWVQYMERQEAQRAVEGLRARFPGARLMTAREWLRLSDRRGEAGGC